MKIAKQQLLKLIKEELETVMKEVEELEEAKKDPDPSASPDRRYRKEVSDAIKKDLADQDKNNALRQIKKKEGNRVEEGLDEAEELEEIKGPMGGNLAKFGREMARPTGGDPSNSVRSAIRNVDLSADKRDEPDDDYYADDDQLGSATKDEEIDGMLSVMGVDPQSQEGMDLRVAIKAAAEKVRARSAKRYGQVAQGGLNEEEKEMKQISESFRRFTKVLKG
jgi:hypothetical protein